jgi:gamma-glutamyltranspeptidase/glutathione hydrolase
LLAPAIRLASTGFVLTEGDLALFRDAADALKADRTAALIFLKDGKVPFAAGDLLKQPDLAATLSLIAEHGADAFYTGPIADAIVAASRRGHGILQKADFERYRVRELAPVECRYRGYTVTSAPPPSSGGTTLCEMLNILEGYKVSDWAPNSAESVHYLVEAMRHAYADRNTELGDPDFIRNPVVHLIDKDYAGEIRRSLAPDRAGSSASAGTVPREGNRTTHYSVVDAAGTAVAVTYTLNDWFGAKVVAGGTGILLNDEMDDFTAKPGVPNQDGLVTGAANAIRPLKTPLSSMTPTIVSRDGRTVLVLGSEGGPRIITQVLQVIVNVIDHGMSIGAAVDAPRIHHQFLPDAIAAEPGALSAETRRQLQRMGYRRIVEEPEWGMAECIMVGGDLKGANDRRAVAGAAIGY